MSQLPKCKITIIKKTLNRDLIDEYIIDEYNQMGSCGKFENGQEFIVDPNLASVPENFCEWAWADIRNDIVMISSAGQLIGLKILE